MNQTDAIALHDLDFRYPGAAAPLFAGLSLRVPAGARCLLLGQNGTGKTTLLRILAGKHLVPAAAARVLCESAFHATALVHRVAFLGGTFPFDVDMSVEEVLAPRLAADPRQKGPRAARAARLLEILGVEPTWRMHRLSDGQRRRVQVLLGLLDEVDVVLLDEVTADLDVLARADLLALLNEESRRRGTTVLYATHVLDGLERWATHLCFLSPAAEGSTLRVMAELRDVPELRQLLDDGAPSPMLTLCERWLREDRRAIAARAAGSGA